MVTGSQWGQLVLGSAQWGMPYGIANRTGRPSVSELERMLEAAKSDGVHTIDTARRYGASEEVIGRLVGRDPTWHILTKLPADIGDGCPRPAEAVRRAQYSVQSSHEALRRDVLDGLLLHRASHRTQWDGAVWEFLLECRREGSIQALGISAANPSEANDALTDSTVELLQVASSLLDQRLARSGLIATALSSGKAVFTRSPFLQGAALLEIDELPGHLRPLASALTSIRQWATARSLPAVAPFLAYARSSLGTHPVVGAESLKQLSEILAGWNAAIEETEVETLALTVPDLPEQVLDPSLWPRT